MSDWKAAAQKRAGIVDADLLRSQLFIDGRWTDGRPDASIAVDDPATGAIVANIAVISKEQLALAIAAAEAAFPAWAARPAVERGAIVRRWHDLVVASTEDLARIVTLENGKTLAEARAEVRYAAGFLRYFAEEAGRAYGEIIPATVPGRRLLALKQPVGVSVAITPWNFPLAMLTRKAGPALAAGCPMIAKPASQTPLAALALAVLAERAGVPAGVLQVITGKAGEVSDALTASPVIRKLSFTGSTEVGALLMAKCAPTVKRLSLELGGNAPLIVFDDADVAAAVEGALVAKFRNGGQSCIAANRIYVQAGIYDRFVSAYVDRVSKLKEGDGFADGVDIGPLIDEAGVAKVVEHVADATARGAEIAVGAKPSALGPRFFTPGVLLDVPLDAQMMREETFGPVAPIARFETDEEAIRAANDTPFGLASYIFTQSNARIWRASEAIESGMVGVNTGLISSEVAPFGGVKASGLGREGHRVGLDEYLETKYVCQAGL